jgi:hypothetical protein
MKAENETGLLLRDAGAKLALANAGEEWHDMATTLAIKYFTDVGWDGALFENARAHAVNCGVGVPPSANAWGALALSMSKRNLISKTGVLLPSKAVRSHGRSQPVWRLTSLHAQSKADAIKPWVGLTTEEIHKAVVDTGIHVFEGDIYKFVQMLQDVLQEKNS